MESRSLEGAWAAAGRTPSVASRRVWEE
uniref:Uncharacterized protein n=1 Tax=Arundo donax TaxID=35708 RepID=A0A0A9EDU4_ARUDO